MVMKYFDIAPGMKVYTLDICEALKDHELCPGFTPLSDGEHELGPVGFICACHKKVEAKPS